MRNILRQVLRGVVYRDKRGLSPSLQATSLRYILQRVSEGAAIDICIGNVKRVDSVVVDSIGRKDGAPPLPPPHSPSPGRD